MCDVSVSLFSPDDEPATGTGTLIIHLSDVNDNAPVLEQRRVQMCSTDPEPVQLTITDQDGPDNSLPFHVEIHSEYQHNWTVVVNSSGTTNTLKITTAVCFTCSKCISNSLSFLRCCVPEAPHTF